MLNAVFVYQSGSCDGAEKQVHSGDICVNIASFQTIKVFCG
jgi:hypothetical protein